MATLRQVVNITAAATGRNNPPGRRQADLWRPRRNGRYGVTVTRPYLPLAHFRDAARVTRIVVPGRRHHSLTKGDPGSRRPHGQRRLVNWIGPSRHRGIFEEQKFPSQWKGYVVSWTLGANTYIRCKIVHLTSCVTAKPLDPCPNVGTLGRDGQRGNGATIP